MFINQKELSSEFTSIDYFSLYALLSAARCFLESNSNDIPELREVIEKIELKEFGHIFT